MDTGEAWTIAARQAIRRIVRGDGDGMGEEGWPIRWIVVLRGVAERLDDAFSFSVCGSFS